ncbi:MAG: site-specific DNA-methyltransferase [Candidatus Sericytochromatia bacterium]|nr:site-specific DNA-methyltransferase [Candidatus Tanganyikabacteria bacterium]
MQTRNQSRSARSWLQDAPRQQRPAPGRGAGSVDTVVRWPRSIALRPIAALRPSPNNPRTHSAKQIQQLVASIRRFGFVVPLLTDGEDRILAGHGRLEAAKLLGMAEVPALRIEHLSEAERRAYTIADNRLAQLSGWDEAALAAEFEALEELAFELPEVTGFETAQIDQLLEAPLEQDTDPDDAVAEPDPSAQPVSRPGDLWQLGPHRLLHGDGTKAAGYVRLMGDERARMVITDPPYNVPIAGHVSGLGRVRHREFTQASGELSSAQFAAFLRRALTAMAAHCRDGALIYTCMDWRHVGELLAAARPGLGAPVNLCVWAKTNAGMGSLYRSQHELVLVFKAGKGPHLNNVQLGATGRYRSNLWTYAGANAFGRNRDRDLADHPTVKPVALVADVIRDCSRRGEIVLDGFCGSGTTLLAAERTGRVARAIELDGIYIDVAIRRFAARTGVMARHAASGRSFGEIAAKRGSEPSPNRRARP